MQHCQLPSPALSSRAIPSLHGPGAQRRRGGPSCLRVQAAASLQLATAKIPSNVDKAAFGSNLYQWASSLTTSGQNMPFVLPIKCDKTSDGFKLSLINISGSGRPVSVGDIVASVESSEGDDVLFVRFYEGPGYAEEYGRDPKQLPQDSSRRLKQVLGTLQDVPVIMRTMPTAIRRAVLTSQ